MISKNKIHEGKINSENLKRHRFPTFFRCENKNWLHKQNGAYLTGCNLVEEIKENLTRPTSICLHNYTATHFHRSLSPYKRMGSSSLIWFFEQFRSNNSWPNLFDRCEVVRYFFSFENRIFPLRSSRKEKRELTLISSRETSAGTHLF